ncbi:hypothetical protein E2562_037956 [Oryza meyeriana var. granulata]|uniref:Uncharacterized protein n=1 Tax=Oryza meyeriana var. granulata TaxID=110450 RepID=A0A6G1CM10_9ORYZ|nr:hypothetical protein E2562_037956 [Oryza meyeriana var. granulata]
MVVQPLLLQPSVVHPLVVQPWMLMSSVHGGQWCLQEARTDSSIDMSKNYPFPSKLPLQTRSYHFGVAVAGWVNCSYVMDG